MRRGLAFAIATGAAMVAIAPAAQADHHSVSITEVFPGTTASPTAEFVELTMYSGDQNNFAPAASLTFYNASGGTVSNLDLADVPNGQSQRTLLAGSAATETVFTVSVDTEYSGNSISNAGGGVCLVSDTFPSPIDCVAWGTATVVGAGAPEAAIPDGSSIRRDISRGCNTLLEAGDDTDSSLTDFAPAFPAPQPNSDVGINSTCPNTTITKKPKAKTRDRTPKFKFSGGDGFLCSLDGSKAAACDSGAFAPGRISKGKHKFQVRATQLDGSVDGTPAKYSWKIVKK
jgi:hypothetical protein